MAITTWQEKAQRARNFRDDTLERVEPPLEALPSPLPLSSQGIPKMLLTPREYELTQEYDAIELLRMLREKTVSSEELTRAFLRRAAIAQYAVNCVTELMWDEAIERAKHLDSLPEPLGSLHGLPISVKEHHGMDGKPTHASNVAWIGRKAGRSPINDILYAAGCVFYVRTTGPQTLMSLECSNNIYHRTVNPWNRELTCGGSSGGEGALVAMRGSVFVRLGCDIGGSVRAPASNNGIYGFKPTSKRIPLKGMVSSNNGRDSILATYGPLVTSPDTIHLFMKTILDTKPWRLDPSLAVKPWTPETLDKPLKIAIEWSDGVVKPHPPTIRGMQEVAAACKAAGTEVIDWIPYKHDYAWDLTSALYFPDGAEDILAPLHEAGEPIMPLTDFITKEQPYVKKRTMLEYWALCAQRDEYRCEYAEHWSKTAENGKEVDVILCPSTPGVAPLHETARYWPYTSQWNLLDYPAVVFPVGFVDQEKDIKDDVYVPMNEQDRYNYELYSPEKYTGAPVSLTIVGRRCMDEKVMAALAEIERAMGRK